MDHKEQINTIISMGAGLPPVNPYLDDQDDDDGVPTAKSAKNKAGRNPSKPAFSTPTESIAPDPKEYIAELERSEEDTLY